MGARNHMYGGRQEDKGKVDGKVGALRLIRLPVLHRQCHKPSARHASISARRPRPPLDRHQALRAENSSTHNKKTRAQKKVHGLQANDNRDLNCGVQCTVEPVSAR